MPFTDLLLYVAHFYALLIIPPVTVKGGYRHLYFTEELEVQEA